MDLIQILKGARKRIEAADYLPSGFYHKKFDDYRGECYCAVGHIFKEIGVKDEDMMTIEGAYLESIDLEYLEEIKSPILETLEELSEHNKLLVSLQYANDHSYADSRKEKVLKQLDFIINKLEGEQ